MKNKKLLKRKYKNIGHGLANRVILIYVQKSAMFYAFACFIVSMSQCVSSGFFFSFTK